VKEAYFYLDALPTHSYQRALYKYPQRAYPYLELVEVNRRRSKQEPEYEITDTEAFDENRYFDVEIEYAKAGPDDILIQITATNRGPDPATLHLLPTLWFRNTWSWGRMTEDTPVRPELRLRRRRQVEASTPRSGFLFGNSIRPTGPISAAFFSPKTKRTSSGSSGWPTPTLREGRLSRGGHRRARRRGESGGDRHKAAAHYELEIAPGQELAVRLRLVEKSSREDHPSAMLFPKLMKQRRAEADTFYGHVFPIRRRARNSASCARPRRACSGRSNFIITR
jgi:hypothetical protein